MCVLSHYQGVSLLFRDIKNKSQLIVLKLLLDVLRRTEDNTMEDAAVEKVELKIDGLYQVQDSLHHRKYIFYFHGKYIKSQRLTVTATTDLFLVTAECYYVSEISIWCCFTPSRTYTSDPRSRYKLPQPPTVSSSSYGLLPNYTGSYKKTVISVLITFSSFTPTALTKPFTHKITFRQNYQRHCSVKFNIYPLC